MSFSTSVSVRAAFAIALTTFLACSREPTNMPEGAREAFTPTIDVEELSATEARARMTAGTLTSRALTQAYLDRIATMDDAGVR